MEMSPMLWLPMPPNDVGLSAAWDPVLLLIEVELYDLVAAVMAGVPLVILYSARSGEEAVGAPSWVSAMGLDEAAGCKRGEVDWALKDAAGSAGDARLDCGDEPDIPAKLRLLLRCCCCCCCC